MSPAQNEWLYGSRSVSEDIADKKEAEERIEAK